VVEHGPILSWADVCATWFARRISAGATLWPDFVWPMRALSLDFD